MKTHTLQFIAILFLLLLHDHKASDSEPTSEPEDQETEETTQDNEEVVEPAEESGTEEIAGEETEEGEEEPHAEEEEEEEMHGEDDEPAEEYPDDEEEEFDDDEDHDADEDDEDDEGEEESDEEHEEHHEEPIEEPVEESHDDINHPHISFNTGSEEEHLHNFKRISEDLQVFEDEYIACIDEIHDEDFSESGIEGCLGKDFIKLQLDIKYEMMKVISRADDKLTHYFIYHC